MTTHTVSEARAYKALKRAYNTLGQAKDDLIALIPPAYSVYPMGDGLIAVVTRDGYQEFKTFREARDYIDKLIGDKE